MVVRPRVEQAPASRVKKKSKNELVPAERLRLEVLLLLFLLTVFFSVQGYFLVTGRLQGFIQDLLDKIL